MKQSRGKKSRDNTAFLYVRLSRDDNQEGDSYSIQNQKKLLTKVAKEKGYTNLITFSDDGISGVTMNRPDFQKMLACIEAGQGAAVFVKDLSRLGRNYIEVGRLTEDYFPEHNIRLVAVSDNIDTDEGENELTPIRNLFKSIHCLRQVEQASLKTGNSTCQSNKPIINLNLLLLYAININAFPDFDTVNQFVNDSTV